MKTMYVRISLFLSMLILGGIAFYGCSDSRLVDVWKDPQYDFGSIKKVVVIAAIDGNARRRIWEDSFVKILSKYGIEAVPSYKSSPGDIPKPDDVHKLFDNKYDGVVLVHQLKTQVYHSYVPGGYYWEPIGWYRYRYPFYRHYWMAYSYYNTPGYFVHERVFNFTVGLYEANENGNLLWEGTGQVRDPRSQKELIKELSNLVVPKMMNKQSKSETEM